jgi:hypothetical protein
LASTDGFITANSSTVLLLKFDLPLVSGNIISQNVSLYLKDDDNRVMITDNSSTAVMSCNQTGVQVMKSKTVTSMMGHLYFDDAIIIGPPGTKI